MKRVPKVFFLPRMRIPFPRTRQHQIVALGALSLVLFLMGEGEGLMQQLLGQASSSSQSQNQGTGRPSCSNDTQCTPGICEGGFCTPGTREAPKNFCDPPCGTGTKCVSMGAPNGVPEFTCIPDNLSVSQNDSLYCTTVADCAKHNPGGGSTPYDQCINNSCQMSGAGMGTGEGAPCDPNNSAVTGMLCQVGFYCDIPTRTCKKTVSAGCTNDSDCTHMNTAEMTYTCPDTGALVKICMPEVNACPEGQERIIPGGPCVDIAPVCDDKDCKNKNGPNFSCQPSTTNVGLIECKPTIGPTPEVVGEGRTCSPTVGPYRVCGDNLTCESKPGMANPDAPWMAGPVHICVKCPGTKQGMVGPCPNPPQTACQDDAECTAKMKSPAYECRAPVAGGQKECLLKPDACTKDTDCESGKCDVAAGKCIMNTPCPAGQTKNAAGACVPCLADFHACFNGGPVCCTANTEKPEERAVCRAYAINKDNFIPNLTEGMSYCLPPPVKKDDKNLCGNAKRDPGEQCDPAFDEDKGKGCKLDCTLPPGKVLYCAYVNNGSNQGFSACTSAPICKKWGTAANPEIYEKPVPGESEEDRKAKCADWKEVANGPPWCASYKVNPNGPGVSNCGENQAGCNIQGCKSLCKVPLNRPAACNGPNRPLDGSCSTIYCDGKDPPPGTPYRWSCGAWETGVCTGGWANPPYEAPVARPFFESQIGHRMGGTNPKGYGNADVANKIIGAANNFLPVKIPAMPNAQQACAAACFPKNVGGPGGGGNKAGNNAGNKGGNNGGKGGQIAGQPGGMMAGGPGGFVAGGPAGGPGGPGGAVAGGPGGGPGAGAGGGIGGGGVNGGGGNNGGGGSTGVTGRSFGGGIGGGGTTGRTSGGGGTTGRTSGGGGTTGRTSGGDDGGTTGRTSGGGGTTGRTSGGDDSGTTGRTSGGGDGGSTGRTSGGGGTTSNVTGTDGGGTGGGVTTGGTDGGTTGVSFGGETGGDTGGTSGGTDGGSTGGTGGGQVGTLGVTGVTGNTTGTTGTTGGSSQNSVTSRTSSERSTTSRTSSVRSTTSRISSQRSTASRLSSARSTTSRTSSVRSSSSRASSVRSSAASSTRSSAVSASSGASGQSSASLNPCVPQSSTSRSSVTGGVSCGRQIAGTVTTTYTNGQPHSRLKRVAFPATCADPVIKVVSKTKTIQCGTPQGPGLCPNGSDISGSPTMQRMQAYVANVSDEGFDILLSATNGVWVGATSPQFSVDYEVLCGPSHNVAVSQTQWKTGGMTDVRFKNGDLVSTTQKVVFEKECTGAVVTVLSYHDSIKCGTTSGPTICSTDRATTSQDLYPRVLNVTSKGFDVRFEEPSGVWVGASSPNFPIAWTATCEGTLQCSDESGTSSAASSVSQSQCSSVRSSSSSSSRQSSQQSSIRSSAVSSQISSIASSSVRSSSLPSSSRSSSVSSSISSSVSSARSSSAVSSSAVSSNAQSSDQTFSRRSSSQDASRPQTSSQPFFSQSSATFVEFPEDSSSSVFENTFPPVYVAENTQPPSPAPLCGNKTRDRGEECDDGNNLDLDGCSAYCLLERGRCRDGVIQRLLGEQCEPALSTDSPLKCGDNCRYVLAFCGDNKVDAGELCDAGVGNTNLPNAACRPDCSPARCGDYIVDTAEQCDDGNRLSGDGCDSFCRTTQYSNAMSAGTLPATVIDLPYTPDQPSVPGQAPQQPVVLPGQLSQVPATTDTGPEVLGVMAAGAAAGYAWMRRRRAP